MGGLEAEPVPLQRDEDNDGQNSPLEKVQEFHSWRRKIKPLFLLLDKFPSTELEEVIYNEEWDEKNSEVKKYLTDSKFGDKCHALHEDLRNQVLEKKKEAESLWMDVQRLWKGIKDNEDFQLRYSFADSTVLELVHELKEQLMLRENDMKEKIPTLIIQMRNEITEIWEELKIGEDERNDFKEFHIMDHFTPELLDIHREELLKWQMYHKNHELLDKIQPREEMWNTLRDLVSKAEDPHHRVSPTRRSLTRSLSNYSNYSTSPRSRRESERQVTELTQRLDSYGRRPSVPTPPVGSYGSMYNPIMDVSSFAPIPPTPPPVASYRAPTPVSIYNPTEHQVAQTFTGTSPPKEGLGRIGLGSSLPQPPISSAGGWNDPPPVSSSALALAGKPKKVFRHAAPPPNMPTQSMGLGYGPGFGYPQQSLQQAYPQASPYHQSSAAYSHPNPATSYGQPTTMPPGPFGQPAPSPYSTTTYGTDTQFGPPPTAPYGTTPMNTNPGYSAGSLASSQGLLMPAASLYSNGPTPSHGVPIPPPPSQTGPPPPVPNSQMTATTSLQGMPPPTASSSQWAPPTVATSTYQHPTPQWEQQRAAAPGIPPSYLSNSQTTAPASAPSVPPSSLSNSQMATQPSAMSSAPSLPQAIDSISQSPLPPAGSSLSAPSASKSEMGSSVDQGESPAVSSAEVHTSTSSQSLPVSSVQTSAPALSAPFMQPSVVSNSNTTTSSLLSDQSSMPTLPVSSTQIGAPPSVQSIPTFPVSRQIGEPPSIQSMPMLTSQVSYPYARPPAPKEAQAVPQPSFGSLQAISAPFTVPPPASNIQTTPSAMGQGQRLSNPLISSASLHSMNMGATQVPGLLPVNQSFVSEVRDAGNTLSQGAPPPFSSSAFRAPESSTTPSMPSHDPPSAGGVAAPLLSSSFKPIQPGPPLATSFTAVGSVPLDRPPSASFRADASLPTGPPPPSASFRADASLPTGPPPPSASFRADASLPTGPPPPSASFRADASLSTGPPAAFRVDGVSLPRPPISAGAGPLSGSNPFRRGPSAISPYANATTSSLGGMPSPPSTVPPPSLQ